MATSDPVYMGRGTTAGIGVETTWGTAVARTNWLRLLSASLIRTIAYADVPSLGTYGQVSANARRRFAGLETAGGDLEWVGSYDDSTMLLLKNALGACTDAGGPAYTHTMTLAKDLGEGLSIELIRGELPAGTAISEVFEGCLISRLELAWKAGDVMRCKASLIAETAAARGATGSPTYTTGGEPVTHAQMGALTWNAVARKVRELTVTLDNKLESRNRLGSSYTERPQRSADTEVRVRAVLEVITGDALYTAYLAQTQADMTFTFTSGSKIMAFTLQNAEIDTLSDPISSAGVLTQTVEWRALTDGTDEGLKIVATNANATYLIN